MVMTSDANKPEIEDDADQWDWVPVERRNSRRAVGAIVLAGSCLTLGVLIGVLSAPIVQRTDVKPERTASDVPRNSANIGKPLSKPSLALGGPSETSTKPQEAPPKVPVVINEGSAKLPVEQPRARDVGQTKADVTEAETPFKPQDLAPKGSADDEATRPRANLKRENLREKNVSATPDKPRTVERSFKDYRDLRNYALGK